LSPPLGSVLEFLPSIHTEEKAYSTIYVHHLMLSSTLPLVDNRRIGQHSLVKSLMSGCQSSRQSSQKVLAWIFPGLRFFLPRPFMSTFSSGRLPVLYFLFLRPYVRPTLFSISFMFGFPFAKCLLTLRIATRSSINQKLLLTNRKKSPEPLIKRLLLLTRPMLFADFFFRHSFVFVCVSVKK
jgi:hypothetical protein